MGIFYKKEHQDCHCYQHSEKPQVEVGKIEKGKSGSLFITGNEIVFFLEGRIWFIFNDLFEYEGKKGESLFLPAGRKYNYQVMADTVFVIFRMYGPIQLCDNFKLENLKEFKQDGVDYQHHISHFSTLNITPRLWHFLVGVNDCVSDGLRCKYYFEAKMKELLLLLRAYYNKSELYDFFFIILNGDTTFSETIRQNWHKYTTVKGLADSMHLTRKQFNSRFLTVFGKNPQQWINEARAKVVCEEILHTDKQFKEIASDNGFASDTDFTRFCKKVAGSTPTEIRKRRNTDNY